MIAIIPGHSSDSPGYCVAGHREYDVMLELADRLDGALDDRGCEHVVLHRPTAGTYTSRMQRLADEVGAWGADLVVELHWDSRTPEHPWWSGAQAVHWPGAEEARRIGARLASACAAAVGIRDAGTLEQRRSWALTEWVGGRAAPAGPELLILSRTSCPAIILECCNAQRDADRIQLLEALHCGLAGALADALVVR